MGVLLLCGRGRCTASCGTVHWTECSWSGVHRPRRRFLRGVLLVSYSVPTFNLSVHILTGPYPGVLRLETMANLAWGRRVNVPSTGGTAVVGVPLVTMVLLLPVGTDVRDGSNSGGADVVEVPAGSGRTYSVTFVDDIGKGFANEHRAAVLQKVGVWPTPIP